MLMEVIQFNLNPSLHLLIELILAEAPNPEVSLIWPSPISFLYYLN